MRQALQLVVAFGIVSACATSSVMPRADVAVDARLNTRSLGTKWMCVDHQRRPIVPDANGYAPLPVGERVTIGADDARDLQRFGAQPCVASASFVPRAGRSYFLGFENQMAFRNPDGDLVLVVENETAEPLDIGFAIAGKLFRPRLPGDSFNTIVIPGTMLG